MTSACPNRLSLSCGNILGFSGRISGKKTVFNVIIFQPIQAHISPQTIRPSDTIAQLVNGEFRK